MSFTIHDLEDSIVERDIEKPTVLCKELIKRSKPEDLFDAIGKAWDVVGQKCENGEYFLSELIMALGTVVLATVKRDIHEIGKNIVVMLLRSSDFNVNDLGADAAADDIANSVKQYGVDAWVRTAIDGLRICKGTTILNGGTK